MEPEVFASLVFEMRTMQKRYFRTRDVGDLRRAKDLERKVDQVLASMYAPKGSEGLL